MSLHARLRRFSELRLILDKGIEVCAVHSVAGSAQTVEVRHAVRDVLAVRPHAEDRRVSHGLRPLWDGFLGDMYLDLGAFGELHVFQWLEDAVLVSRGNRHGLCFPYL